MIKTFKEKNGFTLIELLAVIVVLAIVMVMASTTILPYLSRSRYNAFAIEVNATRDAASKAMTLVTIGSITSTDLGTTGADYNYTQAEDGTTKYCFSLKKLIELGIIENKDIDNDLGADKYEGRVIVENKKDSRAYTYTVSMHSSDLAVKNKAGELDGSDKNSEIINYVKASGNDYNCSSIGS